MPAVPSTRRWSLPLALGAAVSVCTYALTRAAAAQGAAGAPTPGEDWHGWLQDLSNVGQLIQAAAFLFSAYQFWATRNERRQADAAAAIQARKDSNLQAWQVINSAQGKGGSGGRADALHDLVRNGVSLAGVNVDGAWLEHVELRNASLQMASFVNANLHGAQLQGATLNGANLRGANLVTASLAGASLRGADLTGARLSAADLSKADLYETKGLRECGLAYTNIEGVRHAPSGFREWAIEQGAVDAASEHMDIPHDTSHSTVFRQI
jgi:hypothetical protein